MMMIMTPSNWLKDSAGQTRMESIKDPAPQTPSNKSLLSVSEDIIGVGPRNILLDHHEGQKIDRKNIILGQNIDYGTCLNQEGNEAGA